MKFLKIALIVLIISLGGVMVTALDIQALGVGIGLILAIAGWIIEKQ